MNYYERVLARIQAAEDLQYIKELPYEFIKSESQYLWIGNHTISFRKIVVPLTDSEVRSLQHIAYQKCKKEEDMRMAKILEDL